MPAPHCARHGARSDRMRDGEDVPLVVVGVLGDDALGVGHVDRPPLVVDDLVERVVGRRRPFRRFCGPFGPAACRSAGSGLRLRPAFGDAGLARSGP